MGYELSFTEEFFSGDGSVDLYEIQPSDRPTSILQAIISLPRETQVKIAFNVLESTVPELYVDRESFAFDVLDKARETNYCANLDTPVRVYIDADGFYSVNVY